MSDTPVVAATLALQQAETIFNVDKNVVDGLKVSYACCTRWRRFTLCRGVGQATPTVLRETKRINQRRLEEEGQAAECALGGTG